MRLMFPAMCAFLDGVPRQTCRQLVWIAAPFLVHSTALSATALYRMDQPQKDMPISDPATRFWNEAYSDSVLKTRYSNMATGDEIGG